jgi:transcriptional regulator with XRE-family HTH domain
MTNTISVVGRRIRMARELKRMSQADLAAALGRTPTSISYWESGTRSPGLEDIVRLAEVLGVEAADLLPSQPPRVLARARASQLAIGELAEIVDRVVARYEKKDLPIFERPVAKASPSDMAGLVLKVAGQVNPPIDMHAVMVSLKVTSTEELLPDGLSGFVVFVSEDVPIVVVRGHDVEARRRFSAAHELGHVLLAHHDTFHVDLTPLEGVPPDYNWRYEREANEFASALLMPPEMLQQQLREAVGATTLRLLANRFLVSDQAMSIRLSTLGIPLPAVGEGVELPF